MATPTNNKALLLPIVGDEINLWGPELNFGSEIPIDTLVGGTLTIQSTAGNLTLASSQAYNLLYVVQGALTSDWTLTFPSSTAGGGLYVVDNQTTGNFNVHVNTTSSLSVLHTAERNGRTIFSGNGIDIHHANDAQQTTGAVAFHMSANATGGGGGIAGRLGSLQVPFQGIITQVTFLEESATGSGTTVMDIYKCTTSQFDGWASHPSAGDSITGSSVPTLTPGVSTYQSSVLSGWTTNVSSGDIISLYSSNSNSGRTKLSLTLTIRRT